MSLEKVQSYFSGYGMADEVIVLEESSATVELAAKALGVAPARIAKTLSFTVGDGCVLIVTPGDVKIDNKKFKAYFREKARMVPGDEVLAATGHPVGGVCPFANERPGLKVYLDESLRRFDTVYPACGSGNSAIELDCEQLERYSGAAGWVDVCKHL